MKKQNILYIILSIFLMIGIVGCSGSSENSYSKSNSIGIVAPMEPAMFDIEESGVMMEKMAYAGGDDGYDVMYSTDEDAMPVPTQISEQTIEQKIIRNGHINIEVKDFFVASTKIEGYAQKYNGYVSQSDSHTDRNGKFSGSLSIRVPENHFDALVTEVAALGTVESKNVYANDVTEEFVDLQARLSNSKEHEKRLVQMYDKAENVKEMLSIERELSRVRGEIESSEGRLRYLENRVSYSTLTVYAHEETPVVQEWGIWQSIKNAFNHSINTIRWVIEFIGVLLPLIVIGVLIGFGVRAIIRRKRPKKSRK